MTVVGSQEAPRIRRLAKNHTRTRSPRVPQRKRRFTLCFGSELFALEHLQGLHKDQQKDTITGDTSASGASTQMSGHRLQARPQDSQEKQTTHRKNPNRFQKGTHGTPTMPLQRKDHRIAPRASLEDNKSDTKGPERPPEVCTPYITFGLDCPENHSRLAGLAPNKHTLPYLETRGHEVAPFRRIAGHF